MAALLETKRGQGSGGAKGKALAAKPGGGGGGGGGSSQWDSGTGAWMRRKLGCDLCGRLLQAEYPVLAAGCPEAGRLCLGLADSCAFPRKEVYTAAAGVVGLALAKIEGGDLDASRPCDEALRLAATVGVKIKALGGAAGASGLRRGGAFAVTSLRA